MLEEYNMATIELCGQSFLSEISYEMDDYPIIHAVEILKMVAQPGEYWYDRNGRFNLGPRWIRLEITDFLSADQIGILAQEIVEHRAALYAEAIAENAREKAIESYLNYRKTGEYRQNAPAHYEGVAVA